MCRSSGRRLSYCSLPPAPSSICVVPSAPRDRSALLRRGAEHLTDVGQVLAAPEQLAIDNKARNAKDPDFLRGAADTAHLHTAGPVRIVGKPRRIAAGVGQYAADHADILDVELALPEALEDRVVVAAEHRVTLAPRVQHAA